MGLWSDNADSPSPLGRARRAPEHLAAVERLKDWTRSRFVLTPEDTIVVTEISRDLPGWPEQETVVGFWTSDGTRHHFRIFKRVEAVVEDDLPPPWLKASLAASDGIQCACC